MYTVYEYCGSVYVKELSSGDILYELTEPAVLFMGGDDTSDSILVVKLGNKDKVKAIYDKRCEKAKLVPGLIDEYTYADLPLDVDLLNKIYNNGNALKSVLGLNKKN
jgi:hypothetical protein